MDVTSVSFAALIALSVFHVSLAALGTWHDEERASPSTAARRFVRHRARSRIRPGLPSA